MKAGDQKFAGDPGPVGIVGPCGTRGPEATEPPPGYRLQLHGVVARCVYPPNIEDVMISRLALLWFVLWRVAVLATPLITLLTVVVGFGGSELHTPIDRVMAALLGVVVGMAGAGLAIIPNALFWVINGRGLIGDLQEVMHARQAASVDARMQAMRSRVKGWMK